MIHVIRMRHTRWLVVCNLVLTTAALADDRWVFQPVRSSALPDVRNRVWARQPIDSFILARLEKSGLAPAAEADRRTLIRRLSLDLIGLPLTPAEIETFCSDRSADAYERLVARLLASPQYGERWGRHWLDVARFSESQGFERDKIREHAWRYRDYVIRSLNDDKPYDRFVIEQLAGDVPPDASAETVAATGFLVAGPYDEAGNSSASALLRARIREEELEDIISAVGQTFLGLTVNCARCHDHKFDPVPMRDYYRLHSVFAGIKHGDRNLLTEKEQIRRREQQVEIDRAIADRERSIAELERTARTKLAPQSAAWPADLARPMARWSFDGDAGDSAGDLHGTLRGQAKIRNGRLILNGANAFVETSPLKSPLRAKTLEAWVMLPRNQRGGGVISVEADRGAVFDAIVYAERQARKWIAGSDFFRRTRDLDAPEENSPEDQLVHLAITYSENGRIQVFRNGKPYGAAYTPSGPDATLRTFPAGSIVLFGLRHHGGGNGYLAGEIEEARLYDQALTGDEIAVSFRAGPIAISRPQIESALSNRDRQRYVELLRELAELQQRRAKLLDVPQVYAANVKQPEPSAVLLRGDVEKKGEIVSAGGLSAVASLPADFELKPDAPEGERRRRFAAWVASPRNPLTARVIVNRVWHYHFGRGIVGTPNDFGINGEAPSHPELLDWLAADFVAHGWSLKHLHRRIVLSSTYRQSVIKAEARTDPQSVDADNRLLWRFPLRRLEAETVRDSMLAVAGNLRNALGGPGYRPFTVTVFNSSFYNLLDEDRPEFYRRTVYRTGVQSAKQPLLEAFDCPEPSVKTPRRNATTTPLQALGLMNNSFVQRQARDFASRIDFAAGPRIDAKINYAFELALGRPPNQAELSRFVALAQEHGLATACWVLLNSSEFLYMR